MSETVHSQDPPDSLQADNDLPTGANATPLAALLGQSPAPPELTAWHGVLTPHQLDAPERETEALVSGAAVHDLGWLRRVEVRGEDRFRWLSGMVTNMVNDLAAGAGAWNLVLNAQGRIQGDLHVWREGDGGESDTLELEIAADQFDRLLAHLDHFIIMDDVELASLAEASALGLTGPQAGEVLARLGLPALEEPLTSVCATWNGVALRVVRAYGVLAPHYELWVKAEEIPALWKALTEAGATPVGAATLEAFRVAEGIPAYGIDIAERDLPQETSQMRALHFSKGCYLGQEIVERIRSRGNVHRHLRALELTGPQPAPGVELTFESPTAPGASAGQITSAAELPLKTGSRRFALGMIRGEAELPPQRQGPVAGDPGPRNPLFTYTAGTAMGTARILATPPSLELDRQASDPASQNDRLDA
jgi:folate-binding protein YgfZ